MLPYLIKPEKVIKRKFEDTLSRDIINMDLKNLTEVKKEPPPIEDDDDDLPPLLQV